MTKQLSDTDVASFDRRVAEMKKTEENPKSHTGPGDMREKPASSPPTVHQFEADWSRFEAVFARGILKASQSHILGYRNICT